MNSINHKKQKKRREVNRKKASPSKRTAPHLSQNFSLAIWHWKCCFVFNFLLVLLNFMQPRGLQPSPTICCLNIPWAAQIKNTEFDPLNQTEATTHSTSHLINLARTMIKYFCASIKGQTTAGEKGRKEGRKQERKKDRDRLKLNPRWLTESSSSPECNTKIAAEPNTLL